MANSFQAKRHDFLGVERKWNSLYHYGCDWISAWVRASHDSHQVPGSPLHTDLDVRTRCIASTRHFDCLPVCLSYTLARCTHRLVLHHPMLLQLWSKYSFVHHSCRDLSDTFQVSSCAARASCRANKLISCSAPDVRATALPQRLANWAQSSFRSPTYISTMAASPHRIQPLSGSSCMFSQHSCSWLL